MNFPIGTLLATPGALKALEEAGQSVETFLARHIAGDWGEVCTEDGLLNDDALITGARLLSVYRLRGTNERIWIITEAADDNGRRSATTVLLPSEY